MRMRDTLEANSPRLDCADRLQALLKEVSGGLETDQPTAMTKLFEGLAVIREQAGDRHWDELISLGQSHRLCTQLRRCPLTNHAFVRPRGYPGDAALIDYIYDGASSGYLLPATVCRAGREIFHWLVQARAAEAVRARRRHIATEIARVASIPSTRILSVAAGHARELDFVEPSRCSPGFEFVALDQDAQSLKQIGTVYPSHGPRTLCASALRLLKPDFDLGRFDLIYSLGLFDYLEDELATNLTKSLFSRLRGGGGQLVIANFAPGLTDRAFMEMYLRWNLIYRDTAQMHALRSGITAAECSRASVISIADGAIVCLVLEKHA